MLQKNFKLEVKSVEDDGTFTGYASVTGNVDSDNEIINKGAFKRTLAHNKGVVPILWQHDRNQPVGWNVDASEDGFGLSVKGRLMVDTELGRYAQSFLKTGLAVGAKPGLSIGFVVPKGGDYFKDGQRHFKEVALKEYSIATFQSNQEAIVTGAKADAKTKRVAGEDLTADCFAYVGDPDKTDTWKLPIKFSTEAKTVSHIRNALARFGQTQGIPESEKAGVLAKLKRAAKEHGIDTGDKSQKDFNDSLSEAEAQQALYQERCAFESALSDAIQDALDDDSMSTDEQKAAIEASYSQYAEAMSDWYSRFIDSDTDDDAEEDLDNMDKQEKSGRAISVATANGIKTAMDHIQKGLDHLKPFAERAYTANDTNVPNAVGGGKAENSEGASDEDHALEELLKLARSVADITKTA